MMCWLLKFGQTNSALRQDVSSSCSLTSRKSTFSFKELVSGLLASIEISHTDFRGHQKRKEVGSLLPELVCSGTLLVKPAFLRCYVLNKIPFDLRNKSPRALLFTPCTSPVPKGQNRSCWSRIGDAAWGAKQEEDGKLWWFSASLPIAGFPVELPACSWCSTCFATHTKALNP